MAELCAYEIFELLRSPLRFMVLKVEESFATPRVRYYYFRKIIVNGCGGSAVPLRVIRPDGRLGIAVGIDELHGIQ